METPNGFVPSDGWWFVDGDIIAHFPFSGAMPSDIFRVIARQKGEPVGKTEIAREVWTKRHRSSADATSHAMTHRISTHIGIVKKLLGPSTVVTAWRGGYALSASSRQSHDALVAAIGSALQQRPSDIVVFPNRYKRHPLGHPLSRLGCGSNDSVTFGPEVSSRTVGIGHTIPYDDNEWSLRIDFNHKKDKCIAKAQHEEHSWWYASIGLTGSDLRWDAVDLSKHRWLLIDAKAYSTSSIPIPLRARLKDDASTSHAPRDGHQSTSFSKAIPLRENYLKEIYPGDKFAIDLNSLHWSKRGWPQENTGPVNRNAISQIVIGHDHRDEPMKGTIWIRTITISP